MNSRGERLAAAAFLLLAGASLCLAFRHEWNERWIHGWLGRNGARYSVTARNLVRHPFRVTGGLPCQAIGELDESGAAPYVRHPPLLTWLVAGSFLAFGESENAARAVPASCALLLALALVALAARRGSVVAGAVAAATFSLLPMTRFYGTHVDVQGAPVAAAIALAVLGFARFVENGARAARIGGFIALSLGMWCDWPAWIAAALLVAVLWRRGARGTAGVLVVVVALHAALLAALVLQVPQSLLALGRAALEQRSLNLDALARGDRSALLEGFMRLDALLPWWSCAVPLAIWIAARPRAGDAPVPETAPRGGPTAAAPFPAGPLLFAVGALHVALFPIGALVHDYWAHLLAAPVALLAASAFERLDGRLEERGPTGSVVLRAALLALAVGWLLAGESSLRRRFERETEVGDLWLADLVRAATPPGARILTNANHDPFRGSGQTSPVFRYYLDRKVCGATCDVATLEAAIEAFRPTHFLLLAPPLAPAAPELIDRLRDSSRAVALADGGKVSLHELPTVPSRPVIPPALRTR